MLRPDVLQAGGTTTQKTIDGLNISDKLYIIANIY
jgi:hypothetical protein